MPISQSGMIQTEDSQARLIIVAWPIVRLDTCSISNGRGEGSFSCVFVASSNFLFQV